MTLAEYSLTQWVEALAGRRPTPAGGALAFVTLAGAAALAGKLARLTRADPCPWETRAARLLSLAEEDGEGYLRGEPPEAEIRRLEEALDLLAGLASLAEAGLSPALAADLAASRRLAHAAVGALCANLRHNLKARSTDSGEALSRLETRWSRLAP